MKEILVEVAELDVAAKDLDENDKNLFEDYHFNSILALEYLLKVEEEFDVTIAEAAYQEYVKDGKKSRPIGELWKELEI